MIISIIFFLYFLLVFQNLYFYGKYENLSNVNKTIQKIIRIFIYITIVGLIIHPFYKLKNENNFIFVIPLLFILFSIYSISFIFQSKNDYLNNINIENIENSYKEFLEEVGTSNFDNLSEEEKIKIKEKYISSSLNLKIANYLKEEIIKNKSYPYSFLFGDTKNSIYYNELLTEIEINDNSDFFDLNYYNFEKELINIQKKLKIKKDN